MMATSEVHHFNDPVILSNALYRTGTYQMHLYSSEQYTLRQETYHLCSAVDASFRFGKYTDTDTLTQNKIFSRNNAFDADGLLSPIHSFTH